MCVSYRLRSIFSVFEVVSTSGDCIFSVIFGVDQWSHLVYTSTCTAIIRTTCIPYSIEYYNIGLIDRSKSNWSMVIQCSVSMVIATLIELYLFIYLYIFSCLYFNYNVHSYKNLTVKSRSNNNFQNANCFFIGIVTL